MTLKTKEEIEIVGRERLTPALEIAKKFVSKKLSRPVLEMVNLTPDGNMQATDSHKAIIFKGVHSYSENVCLNIKTLNIEKGWNYPNLTFLLDTKTEAINVTFERSKMQEIITALKFFTNKAVTVIPSRPRVEVLISNKSIRFKDYIFEMTIKSDEFALTPNGEEVAFTMDPTFLILAFETFLKYTNDDAIVMQYNGPLKILLLDNDDFTIGLLPMRTYGGEQ